MNSKVSFCVGLLIGALAGSGCTYVFVSNKKEAEKEEEISSARNSFDCQIKQIIEKNRIEKEKLNERIIEEYDSFIESQGYSTESEQKQEDPKKEEPVKEEKNDLLDSLIKQHSQKKIISKSSQEPYFISYEEYGEIDAYTQRSCVYYANGVLTEDDYEIIDNPEELIGKNNLNKLPDFAENGEYMVWVRNNDILTDFEIQISEDDFTY